MPWTVTVTWHPRISLAAHHDDIALCSRVRVRTLAIRTPPPPPPPPAVRGRGRRIVEDVSPLRKGTSPPHTMGYVLHYSPSLATAGGGGGGGVVWIAGAQKPCHA
jgi:hypothetical protein